MAVIWTPQALEAAERVLENGSIKDVLDAAIYEQMRVQGEIAVTAGMVGFYDAGYDRAIESCANLLENWEIEVGVAKEARGRLPKMVRELRK
jgi:hypothetical protein